MGFRFRKSFRLAPGMRLNVSWTGTSLSLGPRGAKLNLGPKGVRSTAGIPGTGMSWSKAHRGATRNAGQSSGRSDAANGGCGCAILLLIVLAVLSQCDADYGSTNEIGSLTSAFGTKYVNASSIANCRSAPEAGAAISEKLSRGTAVDVLEQQLGWTRISRVMGDCWISDSLLSETMPETAQALLTEPATEPEDRSATSLSDSGSSTRRYASYGDGRGSSGSSSRQAATSAVYYANCSAARAAGAAPVYEGEPGYAPRLDRDRDGVGCE